jgi:DNA-directed RNA polymerase subunit L
MGRLNQYMSDNAKDPNLQKNVSEFVKAVISVYAKNGYHNNFEIRDVFAETAVQETFQKYGVQPDLNYSPANLSAAMQATIQYSAAYTEKRAIQEELRKGLFQLKQAQTTVKSAFEVGSVYDPSSSDDEGSSSEKI